MIEPLSFLTPESAQRLRDEFGTPVFVYDQVRLLAAAEAALAFPHAFGLTVRYAMKANPNAAILRLFNQRGLHFDASSGYEARRAIKAGIDPEKISLSAQELPHDLPGLANQGVKFVATSLNQIAAWGRAFPSTKLALRFNPGVGSGGMNRTNVGGPSASFGIWHEWLDQVHKTCAAYDLTVDRIHTHIGSGSDPDVWKRVALMSLRLVEHFPSATTLDLGGGFKVARMSEEAATDLQEVGQPVADALRDFAQRTGREIHLEIEPGTFLLANSGSLLSTIQDIVSTGANGHTFLRTDTGMTDILRPAMYGAQHPLVVIPAGGTASDADDSESTIGDYQVVGHCCESGDILTVAPGDPETPAARKLRQPQVGDLICIEGAGAYCSAMCAANYNSFPIAPEVMVESDGGLRLIRRRQTLDELTQLEV